MLIVSLCHKRRMLSPCARSFAAHQLHMAILARPTWFLRVVGSGNIQRALLSLAIMLCMWTKQVTLLCILRWHFERHNTEQDIFPCLRIGSGAGKDPVPAFAAMSTSPAKRATGSGAGASSPTSPTESSPYVERLLRAPV